MTDVILVRQESLEDRLRACLRQGRLPDYFLYVGKDAAQGWLDLNRSPGFPVSRRLARLLQDSLPEVGTEVRHSATLVSIGVGDGKKERLLISELNSFTGYVAVDISEPLVEAALAEVADMDCPATGVVAFATDLPVVQHYWKRPVLLCILGNSFCNFAPDVLLDVVWREMEGDDLFLLDCHTLPAAGVEQWQQESERACGSPLNERFNLAPLVAHGADPSKLAFELEFIEEQMPIGKVVRMRKRVHVLEDVLLRFGGERIPLAQDTVLEMGFTYHYTRAQLEALLKDNRFGVVRIWEDRQGGGLLVLARKSLLGAGS